MRQMYAFVNTVKGTELYNFLLVEGHFQREKCGSGYMDGRHPDSIPIEETLGWWLLISAHSEKEAVALIKNEVYMMGAVLLADKYRRDEIKLCEYIKKVRAL